MALTALYVTPAHVTLRQWKTMCCTAGPVGRIQKVTAQIACTTSLMLMRTHQRNLYHYFRKHGRGCTVPIHTWFGVRKVDHLNAIQALERMGLIEVDRAGTIYLTWTISSLSEVLQ